MLIKFLDGTSHEIADLRGTDLRGTDLRGMDLRYTDLRGTDLRGTDLRGANLSGMDLRYTDLRGANLSGTDLRGTDLRGTDLRGANLRGTDLRGANLSGMDLRYTDLRGANLSGTDLRGTEGLERFCILPAGDLVGYKKLANGTIAVLRIPADAKRVNAYSSRKCRAEFAYVTRGNGKAKHDGTPYVEGTRVVPDMYDPDPCVECSHGIHFFITREEAEAY